MHANLTYWWDVAVGYVTEEDIKNCTPDEHAVIDRLIDRGSTVVGVLDKSIIESLYAKNLIYLGVPIADGDRIVVPPLEGFVMNRVLGDYFENLLYKVFVSIDAHTTVGELAKLLRLDTQLVKDAVSAYCRLGHAFKRGTQTLPSGADWHPSWRIDSKTSQDDENVIPIIPSIAQKTEGSALDFGDDSERPGRRVALLFDSTLTAFLMMGNLSSGLKKHAVTMFEAGKLPDEVMDSFLSELDGLNALHEGETQTYFQHAVTLRQTIRFLRRNPVLALENADGDAEQNTKGARLDLLRCESVNNLDAATCGESPCYNRTQGHVFYRL